MVKQQDSIKSRYPLYIPWTSRKTCGRVLEINKAVVVACYQMQQESVVKGGNVFASSCCLQQYIATYASIVNRRFGMLTGPHTKGADERRGR